MVLGFEPNPRAGGEVSASPCVKSALPCPVRLTGQTSTGTRGDSAPVAEDKEDQGPEQPSALVQPGSVLRSILMIPFLGHFNHYKPAGGNGVALWR